MTKTKESVLPSGYTPGDKDVIVGRGKVCYKHSGNQRLNRIVKGYLTTYSASGSTKKSKSELIKTIMGQIREESPQGGFVKFDSDQGEWVEVGDRIAREKVSQTFRDALNDQYRSSTTSKTLKRRQERINSQSSTRSTKDGNSSGSHGGTAKAVQEQQEVPKTQFQLRADSLLMAGTATANMHMLPGDQPGISALPFLRARSNPSYYQNQLSGVYPDLQTSRLTAGANLNGLAGMLNNPNTLANWKGPLPSQLGAQAQANYNAQAQANYNAMVMGNRMGMGQNAQWNPSRHQMEP